MSRRTSAAEIDIDTHTGAELGSLEAGRISRIDGGVRTTVIGNLPSSVDQRGNVLGVMEAFVGPKLYAPAPCGVRPWRA